MSDSISETMRRQQNQDTAQTIEPDETATKHERQDSDAASGAAREAAKAARGIVVGHSEDAVLEKNRRSDYSAENEVFEDGRTDAKPPLAKKDRSLLGE